MKAVNIINRIQDINYILLGKAKCMADDLCGRYFEHGSVSEDEVWQLRHEYAEFQTKAFILNDYLHQAQQALKALADPQVMNTQKPITG